MTNHKFAYGLAAIVLAASSHLAWAGDQKPGVINVSATGKAEVAPDMAVLGLTVMREGKTAREALNKNIKAMTDVLAAMKAAGIEERDLQTSNFNIQPKYFYPKRQKNGAQAQPRIVGYFVNNSLTVRVRQLQDLGQILDTAVTLGVNSGGNIQFSSSNPKAAIEKARANAMANAMAKAKTLTSAVNVGLGRILSISESNRGQPRPRRLARSMAKMEMASDAAPVPIAAGENSYSITVNVQWELAQ